MNPRMVLEFVSIIALIFLPLTTNSQASKYRTSRAGSMTVIGGSSNAVSCYHAATVAAQIHYTSQREADNCTYALDYGNLSFRDHAATLVNRGIIYMALEKYENAIKDYDTAKRLMPDFGEIYINVGNVFFLGKVYDKAIKEYTQAIEKNLTRDHVAYFNRGMAYEKLGDLEHAEIDYRTAIELLPEWPLATAKLEQLQAKKNKS